MAKAVPMARNHPVRDGRCPVGRVVLASWDCWSSCEHVRDVLDLLGNVWIAPENRQDGADAG